MKEQAGKDVFDAGSLDYDPGWMWRLLGEAMYGVYVYDPTRGVNVHVNAEYTRLTGYTVEDFSGMEGEVFMDLFHPEDRARVQAHMDRLISGPRRQVHEIEYRFRTAAGEWIWCHSRDAMLERSGGEAPIFIGSFLDISDRKATEAELQEALARQSETNALLDAIFDRAPVGLGFWDTELRFRRVNRRLAEMNGLSSEAHIGGRPDELFPGIEGVSDLLDRWREVLETGEPWLDVEVRGETAGSGMGIWTESFYPIRVDGAILGLAGVVEEITEQRKAEVEREGLLTALRETDRRKDEFLAVLGHELRNPLAALRNGLAVLEREIHGERAKQVGDMMGRQLSHLVRLVDDLLDLSRVSRGEIELRLEPVDLREVVQEAVELVRPALELRRHRLLVDGLTRHPPVRGDFERLVQILSNLLANAAKFCDEECEIRLSVQWDGDSALVRIRDDGYGIPPGQLESMFEMFTQVPEHRQWTGGGGLGIGLALSRQLAELHGGTLTARSEGLGKGSEFIVTLPVAAAQMEAGESSATSALPAAGSRRVLLVDDNRDAAEALRMLLEMKGHQVRVVHDGRAALEAFADEVPDVILLDIGLPRMDGLEVARRIRALPTGGDVVLCAVTGWGQDEDKRRSEEAGFDIHLTKPVDLGRLDAVLRDA